MEAKNNVFTEEVNKTALSTNNHKTIESIDSVEAYAYGTNEKIICKKEEINCFNIITLQKNY